ncbi:hypothetical protein HZA86_04990 [Candidatus Uhrbacteria bacterium]|nr:hypothetical protein [Candidatus Uhrbacteria bacterium]
MLHHQLGRQTVFRTRRKMARGSIRLQLLLAILTATAGVTYVFLVNDVSTKGYEIQSLRTTSAQTAEELAKIKQNASIAQSMNSVAKRLKELSFIPEGAVEYARPASPVAYRVGTP